MRIEITLSLLVTTLSTYNQLTTCHAKEYEGTSPPNTTRPLETTPPPPFHANSTSPPSSSQNLGGGRGTATEGIHIFFSKDAAFGTIIVSVICLHALTLYLMGQPLISQSGKIKLWEGNINGPENSQQITDWYTFTHILHGFIFYGIGSGSAAIFPSIDIGVKGFYILALIIETLWEVVENSPPVIRRYRKTALANGYNGDSVLNSVCDTVGMTFGFWLAYLIPPLAVLGLLVIEEIVLAIMIRDNLTLNIIQLIHPFESISKWQTNGIKTNQPGSQPDSDLT